jgi:hypothetical protein
MSARPPRTTARPNKTSPILQKHEVALHEAAYGIPKTVWNELHFERSHCRAGRSFILRKSYSFHSSLVRLDMDFWRHSAGSDWNGTKVVKMQNLTDSSASDSKQLQCVQQR